MSKLVSLILRLRHALRRWKLFVSILSIVALFFAAIFVASRVGVVPLLYVAAVSLGLLAYKYATDSLFRRRWTVYRITLLVVIDYKWARRTAARRYKPKTPESNEFWSRVNRRNAKRAYRAFLDLEGIWIKTGQYLSSRADVLPEEFVEELMNCQDQLPTKDVRDVVATVESELGKPLLAVFDSFNPKPIACASIAQVHEAMYRGEKVVVKVQHKNVEDIIRQDLVNLAKIMAWVAWAEPDFDFRPVVNEWSREVPYELDFQHEAENMKRVERETESCIAAPKSSPLHLRVLFPQVLDELTTRRVLVMSYIDGFKVTDMESLDKHRVNRDELVTNIARAMGNQIFRYGFFNGDPHPGNILVQVKNGQATPALLDFGLTKEIDRRTKIAFSTMAVSASGNDLAGLLNSIDDMGVKFNTQSEFLATETLELTKFFFRDSGPPKEMMEDLDRRVQSSQKRMEVKMQDDKSLRRNPIDAFPEALVFFQRSIYLIRGIASALGVRMKYLELLTPFALAALRDTADVTAPLPFPRVQSVSSTLSEKLVAVVDKLRRDKLLWGCQITVWHKGQQIVDIAAGLVNQVSPDAVTPGTVFNVFSCTKAVASIALHRCVELGLLQYSDKVKDHWQGFESECSVAQVLAHTAGLQGAGIEAMRKNLFAICQWDDMVELMARAESSAEPGQKEEYHILSFGWIVGGLVERVSQTSFRDFVQREISEPLGMVNEMQMGLEYPSQSHVANLWIDFEGEKRRVRNHIGMKVLSGRIGQVFGDIHQISEKRGDAESMAMSNPTMFNHKMIRRALIPSANGHFSARALAKLYATLVNGGIVPGTDRRLLREETIRELCTPVAAVEGEQSFGKGVVLYPRKGEKGSPGSSSSPAPFGHGGIGGSFGGCDPKHQLAVGLTFNQLNLLANSTTKILDCICDELKIGRFETASQSGSALNL